MKIDVTYKNIQKEGDLKYNYSPLKNLRNKDGELVDFNTTELKFDLNHPVDILTLESYDGSVNLILNDGKNKPKLINSRFSCIGDNKYKILDRSGLNDTNIYDEESFVSDTSLLKLINTIPKLLYLGNFDGGTLSVGNYHFYFKFLDADGNSTDVVLESGLVSVFIGSNPSGIQGGIGNLNSNKLISFKLTNIDSAYPYVQVFFTRSTSTEKASASEFTYQISNKYNVTNTRECDISITGSETLLDIDKSAINTKYVNINSAKSLVICLNRLFFGNVKCNNIDYVDLQDIALRIYLLLDCSKVVNLPTKNYTYSDLFEIQNSYYDPLFIYNYTGYWSNELYRFGIVFILEDFTTSPVFNIRGILNLKEKKGSDPIDDKSFFKEDGLLRNYLQIHELQILNTPGNCKGVYSFDVSTYTPRLVLGVYPVIPLNVQEYMKKIGIKGYFFVRLKRIPITLCQALTIATDNQSHTPVFKRKDSFFTQGFLDDDKVLKTLSKTLSEDYVSINAAICPEYDVNLEYLNNFFTGNEFEIETLNALYAQEYLTELNYHLAFGDNDYKQTVKKSITSKIIGIPDGTKIMGIDDTLYSAKAGSAEQAYDFEYIGYENNAEDATNLLRGVFGSYIGIPSIKNRLTFGQIINIKTKNQSESELLKIRALNEAEYFAISDRFSIDDEIPTLYRGDCFICQFTHRILRNFNDPSSPYNDTLVDPNTWKDHYDFILNDTYLDLEQAKLINLGDVNAVGLGLWITFTVRSNLNLNIRSVDSRNIEENSKTGHPRGFYPLHPISLKGEYKHPESQVINKGFEKLMPSVEHYTQPDVPFLKNNFTTRIYYSDVGISDSFLNGFRSFKAVNFKDYPNTYGQIVKLIELSGNILCVFEHGVALIPINERSIAGEGSGGFAYINTNIVLPNNPKIISDQFGSLWPESIIKTPKGVYGIDTVAKKIWKTDGTSLVCISDLKVLSFLNEKINLNITVPTISIRNVKTFYNSFKQDIMFTLLYDDIKWNLCYNEALNKFITFYDWYPSHMVNVDNIPISFNSSANTEGAYEIYKHGFGKFGKEDLDENLKINPTTWYGKVHPFEFEVIVSKDPHVHKIFHNLQIVANKILPKSFSYEITGDYFDFDKNTAKYDNAGLKEITNRLDKHIVTTQEAKIPDLSPINCNCDYQEDGWRVSIEPITVNGKDIDLKDRFMKVRVHYEGGNLAIINFLLTFYTISYA